MTDQGHTRSLVLSHHLLKSVYFVMTRSPTWLVCSSNVLYTRLCVLSFYLEPVWGRQCQQPRKSSTHWIQITIVSFDRQCLTTFLWYSGTIAGLSILDRWEQLLGIVMRNKEENKHVCVEQSQKVNF